MVRTNERARTSDHLDPRSLSRQRRHGDRDREPQFPSDFCARCTRAIVAHSLPELRRCLDEIALGTMYCRLTGPRR